MTLLVDRPDVKLWTEKEDGEEVLKLWVVVFYDKDIEETWLNFTLNFETECELIVRPLDTKNHTFFGNRDFGYIRVGMHWLGKSFEEFVGKKIGEISQAFASDIGISPEKFTEIGTWLRISSSDVLGKLIVPYKLTVGVEQESKWIVDFKILNGLYVSVKDRPHGYTVVVGRLFETVNEEKMSKNLPSTQQTLTRIFEEFFRSRGFESFVKGEFWISLKTHPESPIRTLVGHPVTYECRIKDGPRMVYYYVAISPVSCLFGANEYTIPLPPNIIQTLKERKGDDRFILSGLNFYLSCFPDLASKIVVRKIPIHDPKPERRSPHPLWSMDILLEEIEKKLDILE